jgi:hypothetical protein
MKKLKLFVLLPALLALTACFDDSVTEPDPFLPIAADTASNVFALLPATTATTASNLVANAADVAGKTRVNVRADSSSAAIKPYAYFDLDTDSLLAATGDTASWDVAFFSTNIRVNGSFQWVNAAHFDSLSAAPDSGYATGSTGIWYDYSGEPNHTITPKLGKVLVIKTAGNRYAKVQILSYYKGNPSAPVGITDTARYYTFRYFVQKDGSKNLKTAAVAGNRNTFYSLRTAQYADTNSQWDIALRATSVTLNSQYQIVDAPSFDSVKVAPTTGFTNVVAPKAGKIIVFKTSDNKYGKIQFISYYKNNPLSPTSADTARYYTFKYFLQNDGSTNLENGTNSAPYTYYSLRTKATVADSTAQWDLAFRSTNIKVNGSSQLVTGSFDTLSQAPETGYAAGAVPAWYDYSGEPSHTITPKLGKVIVVKTADDKYAKVEILSYYQNAPAAPSGLVHTARYYTFRFVVQTDGTRKFQ